MSHKPGRIPGDDKEEEGITVYENDEAYLWNDYDNNVISENKEGDPWECEIWNHNYNHGQISGRGEMREGGERITSNNKKNEELYANRRLPGPQNTERQVMKNGFVSITSFSKCQSCNKGFNQYNNIPYLFKCNHFFCKECVQNYFTDHEGIKCPIDGLVAQSISQLKVLVRLIEEKPVNVKKFFKENSNVEPGYKNQRHQSYTMGQENEITCTAHKTQKWTHFVEDTHEIICVYCALNKLKSNPKVIIKEINEKCKDCIQGWNTWRENHHQRIELWQKVLHDIQSNKEDEESKITEWYDKLINYWVANKAACLNKVNDWYNENRKTVLETLESLAVQLEMEDSIKTELDNIDKATCLFNEVMEKYHRFIREVSDKGKKDITINEYNLTHDEEKKVIKTLNNCADLKNQKKIIRFNSGIRCNDVSGYERKQVKTEGDINLSNKINLMYSSNLGKRNDEEGNRYKPDLERFNVGNAGINHSLNTNYKNMKMNNFGGQDLSSISNTKRQIPRENNSLNNTPIKLYQSKLAKSNKYTFVDPNKDINKYECNYGCNYKNNANQ